jgi:hypothetical protein
MTRDPKPLFSCGFRSLTYVCTLYLYMLRGTAPRPNKSPTGIRAPPGTLSVIQNRKARVPAFGGPIRCAVSVVTFDTAMLQEELGR